MDIGHVLKKLRLYIDNLQDYPKRLTILFVSLLMLFLSFSTSYLYYQVDSHDRENLYYSYYMRDSSFSMSFWLDENVESAIFECNDVKRERRVAAYSNMTNIEDSLELSSGLVDVSEMSVKRVSVKEMYWNASDHLWVWENGSNFSSEITTNKTISIVNLGMPNASGKSSTGSVALDYHYKNMPSFTYKLYSNSELASYWSFNY